MRIWLAIIASFAFAAHVQAQTLPGKADTSPHKVQLITVAENVQLEVLDWGGDGQPLILLTGLGDTAHVFDTFAQKFTDKYHVYAITRRGFGASSKPAPTDENYASDRLADDVLAAIEALGLTRPILAGHSIAGEELSSIGSRHPEKIAGLIYLDATDGIGYYNPKTPVTVRVDTAVVRQALEELHFASSARFKELVQELQITLPQLQRSLQWSSDISEGTDWPRREPTPQFLTIEAIWQNVRMYTAINAPALVIVAYPWTCPEPCTAGRKMQGETRGMMVDALKTGWPKAKVVTIPSSTHYVFHTNEADVVREMNAFMDRLK